MTTAPYPLAPSRRLCGTAVIASSATDETVGMIMIPITIPALNALKMSTSSPIERRNGVKVTSAK